MLVFLRFPSGLHGLWRGFVALAVVPLFLIACDTPNPNPGFPELTFAHKPAIRLNVAKIEIISEYRMPFKAPNIEHLVPVALGAAAERWAADVLKPAGTRGTAQFVITRAPFTEEKLKTKSGIQGIFSIDQSERYEAVLEARIVILDGNRRVGTVPRHRLALADRARGCLAKPARQAVVRHGRAADGRFRRRNARTGRRPPAQASALAGC